MCGSGWKRADVPVDDQACPSAVNLGCFEALKTDESGFWRIAAGWPLWAAEEIRRSNEIGASWWSKTDV